MSDLKAAFLGPQAENDRYFEELMQEVFRDYVYWRRNFHPEDGRVIKEKDKRQQDFEETTATLRQELFSVLQDLKRGVPLHSPRHLGDMVSDQLMAAQIGFIAALFYNQNNVTGRVSPVTTRCEFDYIDSLAEMIGLPPVDRSDGNDGSWGHLASGGTTANMEALWAARNLKYYAVSLKLLAENDAPFLEKVEVDLPNGETGNLGQLTEAELLNLRPEESYELREKAATAYRKNTPGDEANPRKQLDEALDPHSVQTLGVAGLMQACDGDVPMPKIYVPRTVHYCWKKAADVLGLGQKALVKVEVDERYRMDVTDLREKLDFEQPTLMIIGVAGTTEEGAFDPLDELEKLREETEKQHRYSFWLHADAAWGGYFASLLPGMKSQDDSCEEGSGEKPGGKDRVTDVKEFFDDLKNDVQPVELFEQEHPITEDWVKRVDALSRMDSVVVDPHKMGYIPYPAGAVLFADARARDAVSHEAPYLAWKGDAEEGIEKKFMGRWTLEGSRPGTSAVACYLAQSVLPHDRTGHGKVVAQTMVAAQRLYRALQQFNDGTDADSDFKIVSLCQPETNVLCCLAAAPGLIQRPQFLNDLSEKVFDGMTVKGDTPVSDYQYFISKTSLSYDDYQDNIDDLLEKAGIPKAHRGELEGEELTVLRSVVMNPLLFEKEQTFFRNFWKEVATQARMALPSILTKIIKKENQGDRLPILWVEDEAEFETMRQSMEIDESLGQYFNIERVSQPDEVDEVLDDFQPHVSIVDLNLTGGPESVGLESGFRIIERLQDHGMDDILVYSQYLREGVETPDGDSFDPAVVKAELKGDKGIPPESQLTKSVDAKDRRTEDIDLLLRKIFRLVQ